MPDLLRFERAICPDPPVSIVALPEMAQRTFTASGFPKAYYGMMGLRIGYTGPGHGPFAAAGAAVCRFVSVE